MFGTPTSKAGTLFDLIRSSPSTASSAYQDSQESATRHARSGAPSLLSKSPPSIASFNSGSRYQPSSCSTYSASALPASGPARNIFKKQYIHQAIRLVDDALMEQDKGSCCDEAFALDCYLASLEYLLSAFPMETNFDRQIGSVDRQAIVHAKLVNLIRRTEEFSGPNPHEQAEPNPSSPGPQGGWWNGVWRRAGSGKARLESGPAYVSAPSELAAQCSCGRRVLVKIPDWLLASSTPTQEQSNQPQNQTTRRGFIATLWAWLLAGILWAIGIINGIVIPYIVTTTIKISVAVVVYLEKKFQIVNLLLKLVINTIKVLVKISQDCQFNQQVGDFVSWIISHLLRIALAFVKQGDLQNLNQLFDIHPSTHTDRPHPDHPKPTVDNNRLDNLLKSHSQPTQLFADRGSGSSSSRFSRTSDSTYQVNRPERLVSTWTSGNPSSPFSTKPNSYPL
ncbi:hypothetical protein PGT21_011518 [Puccinia graminis f. sp. tritici]|uniref:Uncharacterized protein n=1 Tax=Puccinia graminis f. sp. tritici TaxID=56615 RepID=A0A5B0NRT8_PUCGR|nr:hypothetical protein PGTUg99_015402 [Puccinia graminis f. sp. tritici]KAA1099552.1 hypothetical protein PGT21_011518 [Puccinia graminis f. sp. tritici]